VSGASVSPPSHLPSFAFQSPLVIMIIRHRRKIDAPPYGQWSCATDTRRKANDLPLSIMPNATLLFELSQVEVAVVMFKQATAELRTYPLHHSLSWQPSQLWSSKLRTILTRLCCSMWPFSSVPYHGLYAIFVNIMYGPPMSGPAHALAVTIRSILLGQQREGGKS
jgi:hypothetical protein